MRKDKNLPKITSLLNGKTWTFVISPTLACTLLNREDLKSSPEIPRKPLEPGRWDLPQSFSRPKQYISKQYCADT